PRPTSSNSAAMGLVQFIASRFDRSLSSPTLIGPRAEGERPELGRAGIGAEGERLAALFLERKEGCKVLSRNFRAPHGGEVDLICRDGDVLVFAEVKTRTSEAFGRPSAAVDEGKRRLIAKGALHWLRMLGNPEILFRFDIVEVILEEGEIPKLERIREAFNLPEPFLY
ncbi:MAG: YraN family protein, partial [Verrucomicrobiales bacterium]